PEALEQIRDFLSSYDWGRRLLEAVPEQLMMFGADGGLVGQLTGAASWLVGLATTSIVVLVVGLLTAYRPDFYRRGLLLLVPPGRRGRAGYVLNTVSRALRLWLLARFLSMVVVGVLTGIGLLIAGVPLALTLGLIAGILSFIPYLGPILSVVPALLITLGAAPGKAPWVLLVYVVVQLVESNLITPLIEQETTSVPAALLIVLQVQFATLAGVLGVFLAAPLTVTATALVQLLYVQDMLHERIHAAGESRQGARSARGSVHHDER
ncbi:MAG: AI-2E family transporter, partial [Chitinivibrionales bacterium]|nr:AI-2E family transporter [Chitinivibrionales bacterium]